MCEIRLSVCEDNFERSEKFLHELRQAINANKMLATHRLDRDVEFTGPRLF